MLIGLTPAAGAPLPILPAVLGIALLIADRAGLGGYCRSDSVVNERAGI